MSAFCIVPRHPFVLPCQPFVEYRIILLYCHVILPYNSTSALHTSTLAFHTSMPPSVHFHINLLYNAMIHTGTSPTQSGSCQDSYSATCDFRTFPRVTFLLIHIIPENKKNEWHMSYPCVSMCPYWVHYHFMLTSTVRHVDCWFWFFLPIWEINQNAISFAYGVHLRKTLYGQNQRDETEAMRWVLFDLKMI